MIKGLSQLFSRFEAIKPDRKFMGRLGLIAVAEQKKLVPRKTGNLARSIGIRSLTDTSVETVATANYAAFVEFGTRAHTIVPVRAKVLSWAIGSGKRLSGTARKGAPRAFARRVRHPGTKAQPFMVPGAVAAIETAGIRAVIIRPWDEAA